MKEQLLGKIVMYRHYQAAFQREETDKAWKLYDDSAKALFKFVMGLAYRTIEGDASSVVEVHLGKGIQPTLTMEYDKTIVPLPLELFQTED